MLVSPSYLDLDLNRFLVGLPRRGDRGKRFLPRRPFLPFLGGKVTFAGAAGWSSTSITLGGTVVGSIVTVVVGCSVVVVSISRKSSILPSRTSISCASRNCFANLRTD